MLIIVLFILQTEITLRHLVSHLSGIRHYEKVPPSGEISTTAASSDSGEKNKTTDEKKEKKDEFENQEYLLNRSFPTVSSSLALFQDDELFSKPGTLNYSAIIKCYS